MIEKIKRFFKKIKTKVSSLPAYKKFLKIRHKVAELMKNGLLAFFNAIAPVWNFLFLKKQDPDLADSGIS